MEDNDVIDNHTCDSAAQNDSMLPSPSFDPFLVECPICLEQLKQPKALPCLHTFCLECLTDCIIKDDNLTTFPCPICRKVTMPPDSSIDKFTWANQFPTNALMVEMVKYTKQTNKFCDPCKRKDDKETVPVKWCRICNVYLCDLCEKSFHGFLHQSSETLDIADLKQFPHRTTTPFIRCELHQKKLSLFCEDHQLLVCSLCVSTSHRRCDNILTHEEYAKKLSGHEHNIIHTQLSDGEDVMDSLLEDLYEQMEQLDKNRLDSERDILEERKRIDIDVNKLQSQVSEELTQLYKERKEYLETSILRCKSLRTSMTSTGRVSGVLSSGTDSIQQISIYQRGTAEINSCKQLVRDLTRPYVTHVLRFEHNGDLREKIASVRTMGHINVCKQNREPPRAVCNWLPMSEKIAKEENAFSVKLEKDKYTCSVRSVLWYRDDLILLCDANNKNMKLFTEQGTLIDTLQLADRPWAVCRYPGNRVAVTRPDSKTISIVKVNDGTLEEECSSVELSVAQSEVELPTTSTHAATSEYAATVDPRGSTTLQLDRNIVIDKCCYGLAYVDSKLIVSNGKYSPYQVYSVTQDGKTELLVEHESPSYYITGIYEYNCVYVFLGCNS